MPSFRQMIRAARRRLRLRQTDVAEAIGVSLPFYSQVEAGRRGPFLETTVDYGVLARVLELDRRELEEAAHEDRGAIEFPLTAENPRRNEATLALARELPGMDDARLRRLLALLNEGKKQ